jgi:poly(hydroxyalkanoate) granule-associated protein
MASPATSESIKETTMVKKLKAKAEASGADHDLANAVKESAQQIWLAGLGAFSKAQAEGSKVFNALVRQGNSIQKRTMQMTEDKVTEVTGKIGKIAGQVQHQANGTWDKLEGVFEERVERALKRLGVPTHGEIAELTQRVEELTASVNKLSGVAPASVANKAAKKAAPAAPRRRPAKKAEAAA